MNKLHGTHPHVLIVGIFLAGCAAPGSGDGSDQGGEGGEGGGAGGDVGGDTAGGRTSSGGGGGSSSGRGGSASGGAGGMILGVGGTSGSGGGAAGGSAGSPNAGGAGGAPLAVQTCTAIEGTARDFTLAHPDFDFAGAQGVTFGAGRGMVKASLDAAGKPELTTDGPWLDDAGNKQVASKASFSQWYRDTGGINQAFTVSVTLAERTKVANRAMWWLNGASAFYPIDGKGFGNVELTGANVDAMAMMADAMHNDLFTFELHAEILYRGGELLLIESDDDSWIFINGKLAVDNGGLHFNQPANVQLDTLAATLGLEKGQRYPVAVFFANRFAGAVFRLSTDAIFTRCK